MSVEKIPNMAANGATNARGVGGVKGGHGAHGAVDSSGTGNGFGALLSSLGEDDTEAFAADSAGAATPYDQSVVDPIISGNPIASFATTIPAAIHSPASLAEAESSDRFESRAIQSEVLADTVGDLRAGFAAAIASPAFLSKGGDAEAFESSEIKNVLMQARDMLDSDGNKLLTTDVRSSGVLAGIKPASRALAQDGRSEVSDALGLVNIGDKASRLAKERGRAENALTAAAVPISAAIAGEPGKLDLRVVGEKIELLGRAHGQVAIESTPLAAGQQIEFRRDKAIFKTNSATASPDIGIAIGSDARPTSLSLEGMAPEVGAGMTQGDQSPGTYWMSSDMKNAEMKLDGFGESPVEVSISVHGNQAHVAFRTDEVQTRLALDDAGATLKDMLSKEGLDLTSVSVGTSSAGGDRAQDHRPRQDSRSTRIDNLSDKFSTGTSGNIVPSRVGQLDVFV